MIDFSRLLNKKQKINILINGDSRKRRTVGKIIARDSGGNSFKKTACLSPDLKVIQLGGPISYGLDDLLKWGKTNPHATRLCIDAGGRNHRGFPVHINKIELMHLLRQAVQQRHMLKHKIILRGGYSYYVF